MKTYIGVKILDAEPCTFGDYISRRGWVIPPNENPAKPGFYVRYPDGYVSWSPAEIFRAAYRPISDDERKVITAPVKASFYDRLLAESQELESKIEKLTSFMRTEAFDCLVPHQRTLLQNQRDTMREYADILGQRIATIDPAERAGADALPVTGEIKTTGGHHEETPIPFGDDERNRIIPRGHHAALGMNEPTKGT